MNIPVRLCLVLHNHQPVGNFDGVFEQAYQDSYLPFLKVFEEFDQLKISLHTSGPLMEWLDANHPEYLDRLGKLVADQRVEIIGGAFYEPILTMIPARDRVGQIRSFTHWLQRRLGATINGMWIPERVWEQSLTSDICDADIRYSVLDDFHFKNAGLAAGHLYGHYVTEHDGKLLSVFPGSEQLRYLIPFQDPHQSIEYLRGIGESIPNAVVVFGDDGEKFGTWPDTKQHVYENGWLRTFFGLLTENADWLSTTTLAEAHEHAPSQGKIYIPEGSYREMTEWALPAERQNALESLKHRFHDNPNWHDINQFIRGGFWRNFKARYPESDEMYCRMLGISKRLETLDADGVMGDELDQARQALYRGQCNCSYWHGAFGGLYLPHLRNAVYQHLLTAENLIDRATNCSGPRVQAQAADYNLDGHNEVRLENDRFVALIDPTRGGQLYEFDVRALGHNLLATMPRRYEAYHQKIRGGAHDGDENVASIHDRVVFKQENLDKKLFYDRFRRKSLMDYFYPPNTSLQSVIDGSAEQWDTFVRSPFEAVIRRKPNRIQVMQSAVGQIDDATIKLTKLLTLESASDEMEISYMLEGLPQEKVFHFGIEMNFAGLPANQDDRYFFRADGEKIGHLGHRMDATDVRMIGLADDWLGIRVSLHSDRSTQLWTYPVETVSQSEGGFELVHQSVVVQPHWLVTGDADGRWTANLKLGIECREDASAADSKMADSVPIA